MCLALCLIPHCTSPRSRLRQSTTTLSGTYTASMTRSFPFGSEVFWWVGKKHRYPILSRRIWMQSLVIQSLYMSLPSSTNMWYVRGCFTRKQRSLSETFGQGLNRQRPASILAKTPTINLAETKAKAPPILHVSNPPNTTHHYYRQRPF